MSRRRVVIVPSASASLRDLAEGGAWAWVYAGARTALAVELARRLEGIPGVPLGPLLNTAVDDHRHELLDFDEALEIRNELAWQVTDLAERGPYTSSFLYRCSALLALDRLLREDERNLLLVVDDPLIAALAAGRARAAGREVHASSAPAGGACRRVRWLARFAVHRGRRLVVALRRRPDQRRPDGDVDVLLVTWADGETFRGAGPKNEDTYWGELPGLLRAAGARVGWLALPASWVAPLPEILAGIDASDEWVVVPQRCVPRWTSIRSALGSTRRAARVARRFEIAGVDLTHLLQDELSQERWKVRQAWALDLAALGPWLRDAGVRPRAVVHPFENQSWEKALRHGLRAALPETRVVGYAHTPVAARWFPWSPSSRDLAADRLPDLVVTTGPAWCDVFRSAGYPPGRLRSSAAFRYGVAGVPAAAGGGDVVAVAAAIGHDEALELAIKVVAALGGPGGPRVAIRRHPKEGVPEADFERLLCGALGLEALPENVSFAHDSLPELLSRTRLLVYAATTVVYEALRLGIPALHVPSDLWFDLDPVPRGSDVVVSASEPGEIREAVHRLLAATGAERDAWAERALALSEAAIAPVRPGSEEPFLEALQ